MTDIDEPRRQSEAKPRSAARPRRRLSRSSDMAAAPIVAQATDDDGRGVAVLETPGPGSRDPAPAMDRRGAATVDDNESQQQLAAWCQESSDANDWPEAAQRWRQFRERYPANPWGFVREAIALAHLGVSSTGAALLETAELQFPDEPAIALGFAEFAMAQNDFNQAEVHWRKIRELHPDIPWGFMGEARLLLQRGDPDAAENVLEEFLVTFPDDEGGLVQYAECAQKRDDWAEALLRWRNVAEIYPKNIWGHVGEAAALIELGRLDEAGSVMEALQTHFREAASSHLVRLRGSMAAAAQQLQAKARLANLPDAQADRALHLRARERDAEHSVPPQPSWTIRAPRIAQGVDLSIIMPTYNRGSMMEESIVAFLRCAEKVKAELIVVDDGSRDDTPERLKRLSARYTNLVTERVANGGPARARNLAAEMSRGSLLVFVGDDVAPIDDDFLVVHAAAHGRFQERGQAVLGKISWPSAPSRFPVNFVMSHIQGEGQQQFGYMYMKPYQWHGWQSFYSSNVSLKKNLVPDWSIHGYSAAFPLAAFEDAEFAIRTTERLQRVGETFGVFYAPTAHLVHYHPYTVETFLKRQVAAGMMAPHLLAAHPDYVAALGLGELVERLNRPDHGNFPIEHYFSIFEGLKSWAVVIEEHYGLGSQNWHGDLLRAIFQLAFFEGYLRVQKDPQLNMAEGCRYVLENVRVMLNRAISTEVLGDLVGFGIV